MAEADLGVEEARGAVAELREGEEAGGRPGGTLTPAPTTCLGQPASGMVRPVTPLVCLPVEQGLRMRQTLALLHSHSHSKLVYSPL